MDNLPVKIYNKNYITVVPKDSINIVVKNYSVSYRDQVWVGLVMLFVFICVYAFKKTHSTYNITVPVERTITSSFTPPMPAKNVVVDFDIPKTTPKLDMSQLGDVNITNEKL
jgi:hypothetical protein